MKRTITKALTPVVFFRDAYFGVEKALVCNNVDLTLYRGYGRAFTCTISKINAKEQVYSPKYRREKETIFQKDF